MRKAIAFLVIAGILGIGPPCLAKAKAPTQTPRKPAIVASVEKIIRGATIQAKDLSAFKMRISPLNVTFSLSF